MFICGQLYANSQYNRGRKRLCHPRLTKRKWTWKHIHYPLDGPVLVTTKEMPRRLV